MIFSSDDHYDSIYSRITAARHSTALGENIDGLVRGIARSDKGVSRGTLAGMSWQGRSFASICMRPRLSFAKYPQ